MMERKKNNAGTVDGGEGRGVPMGADLDDEDKELSDRDYLWEEDDPADRRKDPLRKP